ncbi:MAG: hypothetical protein IPH96_02750 [Saprospiraceae bacterium]|nr:hypothetical protein [Saprospiraceae bacterium]
MVPVSGNSQLMNSFSYGDIIYACYNPTTDAWTMEGSAGCSVNHTANTFATGSNQLLSYSGTGSYYNDRSGDGSIENGMGGLAQIKGSQRVVNVVVDPYPYQTPNIATYQNTGGLHWYVSNTDVGITNGIWDNWVQLYGQNAPQNFGKAHGLGDIESVLTPAPIEIGNRVWNDIDSDGIQDAGEAPIQGVTVQLVNSSGIVIATASTDASGNYYFSSGTGMSTTSSIYNITQLLPNMEYIVRIPNVTGGSKQAALGLNSLTTANAGGGTPGTQPDVRDSDGSIVGVNAEATVLTTQIPVSGANNHTFDFGFAAAACNIISITALPGSCIH